jgi:hypothetical protein
MKKDITQRRKGAEEEKKKKSVFLCVANQRFDASLREIL